jgi:hypothetical protein
MPFRPGYLYVRQRNPGARRRGSATNLPGAYPCPGGGILGLRSQQSEPCSTYELNAH